MGCEFFECENCKECVCSFGYCTMCGEKEFICLDCLEQSSNIYGCIYFNEEPDIFGDYLYLCDGCLGKFDENNIQSICGSDETEKLKENVKEILEVKSNLTFLRRKKLQKEIEEHERILKWLKDEIGKLE